MRKVSPSSSPRNRTSWRSALCGSGAMNPVRLFRPVSLPDVHVPICTVGGDPHRPRIAADLAVLDQRPAQIGLEVDLDLLPAIRALDQEFVRHDIGSMRKRSGKQLLYRLLPVSTKRSGAGAREVR